MDFLDGLEAPKPHKMSCKLEQTYATDNKPAVKGFVCIQKHDVQAMLEWFEQNSPSGGAPLFLNLALWKPRQEGGKYQLEGTASLSIEKHYVPNTAPKQGLTDSEIAEWF